MSFDGIFAPQTNSFFNLTDKMAYRWDRVSSQEPGWFRARQAVAVTRASRSVKRDPIKAVISKYDRF